MPFQDALRARLEIIRPSRQQIDECLRKHVRTHARTSRARARARDAKPNVPAPFPSSRPAPPSSQKIFLYMSGLRPSRAYHLGAACVCVPQPPQFTKGARELIATLQRNGKAVGQSSFPSRLPCLPSLPPDHLLSFTIVFTSQFSFPPKHLVSPFFVIDARTYARADVCMHARTRGRMHARMHARSGRVAGESDRLLRCTSCRAGSVSLSTFWRASWASR